MNLRDARVKRVLPQLVERHWLVTPEPKNRGHLALREGEALFSSCAHVQIQYIHFCRFRLASSASVARALQRSGAQSGFCGRAGCAGAVHAKLFAEFRYAAKHQGNQSGVGK